MDVIDRMQDAVTGLLTDADQPGSLQDSVAVSAPRPVLLIAAGEVPDELLAAQHIRAGSPATVQIWAAPGVGHTGALAAFPQEWQDRVGGFLAAALT